MKKLNTEMSSRWWYEVPHTNGIQKSRTALLFTYGSPLSLSALRQIAGMTSLVLILFLPASVKAEEYSAVCPLLADHHLRKEVIHKGNADVSGNSFQVPEIVKVPLNIDLAKRVASLIGKGVELDSQMGMLEIHQDGTVKYNGEDWTAPVNTLCGRSHAVKKVVEVPKPQKPVESAESVKPKPILNRSNILNRTSIINRVSAGDSASQVSVRENRQTAVDVITSQPKEGLSSKIGTKEGERALIEVKPTQAIPPQDVKTAINREIKTKEPELIQGGAYREIFYNE